MAPSSSDSARTLAAIPLVDGHAVRCERSVIYHGRKKRWRAKAFSSGSMDHFELSAKSPSLDLTDHQPAPPIFSSTPLILDDKPPAPPSSSTASSFFLPLTENSQNNDQLVKLNEVRGTRVSFPSLQYYSRICACSVCSTSCRKR